MDNHLPDRATVLLAIVGLSLIASGFLIALLSYPTRFTSLVHDFPHDENRALYAIIAVGLGISTFLKSASRNTQAMTAQQNREVSIALSAGLFLQLSAVMQGPMPWIAMYLLLSTPLLVLASVRYAVSKGYAKLFGAFGLFSVFGLTVLVMLPERRSQRQER